MGILAWLLLGKPWIHLNGRHGLEFREGRRKLIVDGELLAAPQSMVIYSESIRKWEPPFGADTISPEEKERIIRYIVESSARRGFRVEVDEREGGEADS